MSEKLEGYNLTVKDGTNKKANIGLEGHSKQETRSGKNFIDNSKAQLGTKNGVTVSLNNGHVILNGTATALTNIYFVDMQQNLGAGTYVVSSNFDITGKGFYRLTTSGNATLVQGTLKDAAVFSWNSATTLSTLLIQVNSGVTFNNQIIDVQLEKGNVATDYELYGTMPSPDYPSEVESCGDNINLFDKTKIIEGYRIGTDGKRFAQANYFISDYIEVMPNETYTANYVLGAMTRIAFYDKDYNFISANAADINPAVVTTPNNTKYLRFGNTIDKLNTIKLEKGKVPTPYSKYGQGNMNITTSNKNFFGISKRIYTAVAPNTVSVSLINGLLKATTNSAAAHSAYLINNLQIGKNYTISWKNATGFNSMQLSLSDSNGKQGSQIFRNYNVTDSVTFKATTKEVLLNILSSGKNLSVEDLQIELEKATSYVPHQGQTYTVPTQKPFRSIGDTRDCFIKKDGKWYEKHFIKERTINKSDVILGSDRYQNIRYAAILKDEDFVGYNNYGNYTVLSSVLKYRKITAAELDSTIPIGYICSTLSTSGFFIGFPKNITLEEAQSQLENSKLYYTLKTPELIPCTEEQNIILEQLENIYLYEDVNYIDSIDNVPAFINATINKNVESFDFYLSENNRLVFPKENKSYLCSISESIIPAMPEAVETSATIPGRDGDIALSTSYNPLNFELSLYTEDNLEPNEKEEEARFLTRFCNEIKNTTKTFALDTAQKFYKVKYNGILEKTNYPKHLVFMLPFKSSKSYAYDIKKYIIGGNNKFDSNTIEPSGFICVIKGPAVLPILSLNGYEMKYENNLLEGQELIIDTNNSTAILKNNSQNTEFNAMRSYNHQFPRIVNGTNELKVLSGIDDPYNVSLTWYDYTL